MKKTLLTLGICILGFTLVGCGQIPTLKDGKEVVASIKGKKISAEDLYEKLKTQSGTVTLTNMIDEFIANKEVETDEDAKTYAESQIESYKSSYKSYGQDFNEALESAGYKDEDALKDALIIEYKKKTITENYVKGQITDAEIEKYYEDKIFGDIEAKHILISVNSDENATDEEKAEAEKKAKEKAEKLIKKLNKGEDFETLAKENSDDKGTASKGGKLTVKYGEVVDEFWDACTKLKDKTYTKEPVKSEYGYHIIYRESQKEKPKLNAVKDDIIDKIVEEKMEEDKNLQEKAMIDIRKKYKLDITDSDLKKSYNDSVKKSLAEQ
ncbi:MAG: peptidylprolyl isomerase [Bacilli bacterium]|nr:peptidylprolyl isomerase [Bacilli bacterium]